MKSAIAADHDDDGIYKFVDPGYRFYNSSGAGYHPY